MTDDRWRPCRRRAPMSAVTSTATLRAAGRGGGKGGRGRRRRGADGHAHTPAPGTAAASTKSGYHATLTHLAGTSYRDTPRVRPRGRRLRQVGEGHAEAAEREWEVPLITSVLGLLLWLVRDFCVGHLLFMFAFGPPSTSIVGTICLDPSLNPAFASVSNSGFSSSPLFSTHDVASPYGLSRHALHVGLPLDRDRLRTRMEF